MNVCPTYIHSGFTGAPAFGFPSVFPVVPQHEPTATEIKSWSAAAKGKMFVWDDEAALSALDPSTCTPDKLRWRTDLFDAMRKAGAIVGWYPGFPGGVNPALDWQAEYAIQAVKRMKDAGFYDHLDFIAPDIYQNGTDAAANAEKRTQIKRIAIATGKPCWLYVSPTIFGVPGAPLMDADAWREMLDYTQAAFDGNLFRKGAPPVEPWIAGRIVFCGWNDATGAMAWGADDDRWLADLTGTHN